MRGLQLIALLACLGCVACAHSVPPPANPHTVAADALASHAAVRASLSAIRAEARVDQRGERGRIKGTVMMFVRRPAQVRLDVMTQFGPVAIFTSDGEDFAYNDLREKRYLYGPTCPYNIARLLGIALTAEQTTSLLLGGTPVLSAPEQQIEWDREGFYRITLTAPDGSSQQVDLAPLAEDRALPPSGQRLRLLRSELYDARGRSQWRISYEDYRTMRQGADWIEMPQKVRVEQPVRGEDTVIRFKELVLDPEIPPGVFTQQPRGGTTQQESPCELAPAPGPLAGEGGRDE